MSLLEKVKGRIEYGTQKAREGYSAYLGKREGGKPVSTKKAVQELRGGYIRYVHNPVIGSFTGRKVKIKKSATSTKQHKQELAILKQQQKLLKLQQKAGTKGIAAPSVSFEGQRFGNYELNFTGKKQGAVRSSGFDINEMFK